MKTINLEVRELLSALCAQGVEKRLRKLPGMARDMRNRFLVSLVFILLEHWLKMRARAGANDVIRKLMDLALPMASVVRDGRELSIPTAQVLAGDVVVVRPGNKIPVDGVVAAGAADPTAVFKFLTK